MNNKKRVAILGGGLGGLAAAYELTKEDDWHDRYDVTVYQKGWRLGGKGASGRGESDRIEEHGLHCFWGFYDNAFAMLHRCYAELDRKTGPVRSVADAFKPLESVLFLDQVAGRWCRYSMKFLENSQVPGQGPPRTEMSVPQLLASYAAQVRDAVLEDKALATAFEHAVGGGLAGKLSWLVSALKNAPGWLLGLDNLKGGNGFPDPLSDTRELLDQLTSVDLETIDGASAARTGLRPAPGNKALDLLDPDFVYSARLLAESVVFAWHVLRGVVASGIPKTLEDFDKEVFDGRDLRAWLKAHGAADSLLRSQIVMALYNASFCYPEGNFDQGNLSAGVSLRTVLLMGFTYKGAFMWKMQGSMGDVVIAPLYEALVKRGVSFEFFHDVKKLTLARDGANAGKVVDRIEILRQALPRGGHYHPLVEVKGMPSWPARPRYEALEDGDTYRDIDLESDWSGNAGVDVRTLQRGAPDGFDLVVLAIPIAALPAICGELIEAAPRWKRMVDGIKTIRTKSFQLWLKPTAAQHDWLAGTCLMTDVFKDDFNSLADMSQALVHESWPGQAPGSVIYFSTAMADDVHQPPRWTSHPGYQNEQDAAVERQAHAWLSDWQDGIFPFLGKKKPYDPNDFVSEFHRANINADQRYTLSVAGSAKARLAPDESGFENLLLAGDWTKSRLNLGCAEGATMSGMHAGRGVREALGAAAPASFAKRAAPDARALLAELAEPAAARPFIDYPGMPVYPAPYSQKNVTFCQFVLEADADKLQEVVDRYLNVADPEHRCKVLGKWVLFQTGHIASNTSGGAGAAYGTGEETSAAFLIPVARWRGFGGASLPFEVGLFAPFVFVDHPLSQIAGREVLGMPKHLAKFTPAGGPMTIDNMTIETMVIAKLGSASPITLSPLIHVKRPGVNRKLTQLDATFDTVSDAASKALVEGSGDDGAIRTLLEGVFGPRKVPFFSVRQLRDGTDPTRAAFQEVTRGVMHLENVDLRMMAKGHTIELVSYESHRIAEILGLGGPVLEPVAAARITVGQARLEREP
jgi:uncharacterized protein with NAD-binding domain and iron-sulfur cluster